MARRALLAVLALLSSTVVGVETPAERTLEFVVYLEGNEVGSHRYEFEPASGGGTRVLSVAGFKVRFLFFTAFSYEHRAEENWNEDCLAGIEARTNSDGKVTRVEGERTEEGFVVRTGGERDVLSGCVMTFAYWNRDFLEQSRLLNPQTGQYLDVDVSRLEPQTTTLQGKEVEAARYRITAQDMDITVFYSADEEKWLALESTVKGGRILRYEIS